MQKIVVIATLIFLFHPIDDAQAQLIQGKNCSYPAFRTAQGQTTDLEMTVKAGKACRITLGGSLSAISEARILNKASVGSATAQGTAVVYAAKAGFAGSDQFTWAWVGQDRWGNDTTWPVQVTVKVIP
ncbi:hypothetical protein [Microvirga splendida]|uniref:Uncharacterized protein n=1 Tax=Microvirga splendida TaxID=2795727 RepID=A0ABS0XVN4_9HYPH|nr:hypothetical protein [Microvirga splendida]MBJ6124090.1 hypothetical protein [Microvirga splendida]